MRNLQICLQKFEFMFVRFYRLLLNLSAVLWHREYQVVNNQIIDYLRSVKFSYKRT